MNMSIRFLSIVLAAAACSAAAWACDCGPSTSVVSVAPTVVNYSPLGGVVGQEYKIVYETVYEQRQQTAYRIEYETVYDEKPVTDL